MSRLPVRVSLPPMKRFVVNMLAVCLLSGTGFAQDRGFEPGQTLPDIALVDLDGKEVRFSDFLGKRYVLYGWASW